MKNLIPAIAALALLTGAAHAAPPTAEQKAEFYKVCVGISQNETLCTCKADAAMQIVDTDFMAVIIESMRGKALDHKYDVPYNDYIVASTRACGMGGA